MKKIIIFAVVFLIVSFLTSCAMTTKSAYDEEKIVNGDIELQVSSYNAYGEAYSIANNLNMSIKALNHNPKPYQFDIIEAKVIREVNNAEYIASFDDDTILECDMPKTIYFGAALPTSITEDNYYLKIKERSAIYILYLYETPYEMRKDIVLKYKVDGKIVKEEKIKTGRLLPQLKEYLNDDRTRYVDSWEINKEPIDGKTMAFEDIIVEAYSKKIFSTYSSTYPKNYTVISNIEYVPNDGIIVIPSKLDGEDVSISSLGYSNDMKELYLPLVFNVQSSLYLTLFDELKTIYYEGTEEQFKNIFLGKNFYKNANTSIVYNTSYNY